MVAHVVPVDPFDLVVFGATGDLARRKLLPALYHRFHDGQMPQGARVIGVARTDMGADGFRNAVDEALSEFVEPESLDPDTRRRFLACMSYCQLDAASDLGWSALREVLDASDRPVRSFYLSVAPRLFEAIAARIHELGIADERSRLVVEKPLGHDLASARALNRCLSSRFPETQIYRIDHYLGKETVQNLMALRFANTLFEPLWNAHHIDHVQITVAETVGITGRGHYYDGIGAMRDMVQNHLLQLLCLVAMEPPARFEPDVVRDEKLKVLRSLAPVTDPLHVVRGQYRRGAQTPSYHDEAEAADSRTESFVALRAEVSNWRWAGVPFYLRTGKRLRTRMSEIVVQFKEAPHSIFRGKSWHPGPNVLCIRLQPNEGIKLALTIKDPGPGGMRLAPAELDMSFAATLKENGLRMPDAYERLVMDVIRGDQTLFMRGDEVEAAWAWVDPIIAAWEDRKDRPHLYDPGSSGPEDALMLLHRDQRRWREMA
ncbi:glucose-6-phosphate dehydrogenase [Azospirillum sp. ST 5-10]|uniref:glucose-6-phosphate dehydrogenase n=1 Tax=unclassified Azospirillum TaxID=2630922 RepID=UPI003F4A0DB9